MKEGPILPCPYCGEPPTEDWDWEYLENDNPSDEWCVYRCENEACAVKPATKRCWSSWDARDEWIVLTTEWRGNDT